METTSEPDSGPSIDPEASREALRAVRRGQWHAFRPGPTPTPSWRLAVLAVVFAAYVTVLMEGSPLAGSVVLWVYLIGMAGYLWRSRRRRQRHGAPQRWRDVPSELRHTLIRIQLTYALAGLAMGAVPIAEHVLMAPGAPRTVLVAGSVTVAIFVATWLCDRAAARIYRRWLNGQPA